MHNIKFIREYPKKFDEGMVKRGLAPIAAEILERDKENRDGKTSLQKLQERMNHLAKMIGEAKSKGDEASALIEESKEIKTKIANVKDNGIDEIDQLTDSLLYTLPNLPFDEVPVGGEDENQEVRRWGDRREFSYTQKQHFELGENLAMMDFEQTAKISGSRFVTLKSELARLERATANFMLDIHTKEHGYIEYSPPLMVRDSAMFGVGQLPKFAEDSFETTNQYRLIPTAEVSLTNMVADMILPEEELPLRMAAYTPCFRSEAGSAGRDTRGMIRLHQFSKVELVSITSEEKSHEEHERMTACAEEILKRLELPYRVILLASQDMGFSSRKTYDLEVWLPGQDAYREISSCSNCGDFQARRMKARYRSGKDMKYAHTLNGSALAVGRTMVAILENYQNEDGSINIPSALLPYMGVKKIGGN